MEIGKYEYNCARVQGVLSDELIFSHKTYESAFYTSFIECPRLSGTMDVLPVTLGEDSILKHRIRVGREIKVEGQLRSYNKYINGKSKLFLTIFIRHIMQPTDNDYGLNSIKLNCFVCKPPIYRTTPFMREICDLIVAVNRPYGKSDYIPIICWGSTARYAADFSVGTQCKVTGRLQSRAYKKRLESGEVNRIAYEVSAIKLERLIPFI